MLLRELLKDIPVLECTADPELEITAVCYDSRKAEPGCLFVAVSGFAADGNRFIPMAMEKGAAAVKECDRVFERVSTRMLEGFSEEEQGQLVAFRRRMLDNLTKQNHSSCEQEG